MDLPWSNEKRTVGEHVIKIYFTKNEQEFKEIKMYEWIESLGERIMFELIDKAWDNGVNESNNDYVDTMIRKCWKRTQRT